MKSIKIAIVGPESTGKTNLSLELGRYFDAAVVPEVARNYLTVNGSNYTESDLREIAKLQCEAEDAALKQHPPLLICDTTLLVLKIWSEFVYGRCDSWIVEEEQERSYDLFLLTDIDLPWEQDPLREHPDQREALFSLYLRSLIRKGVRFRTIFGTGTERSQRAISIVENFLSDSPR